MNFEQKPVDDLTAGFEADFVEYLSTRFDAETFEAVKFTLDGSELPDGIASGMEQMLGQMSNPKHAIFQLRALFFALSSSRYRFVRLSSAGSHNLELLEVALKIKSEEALLESFAQQIEVARQMLGGLGGLMSAMTGMVSDEEDDEYGLFDDDEELVEFESDGEGEDSSEDDVDPDGKS